MKEPTILKELIEKKLAGLQKRKKWSTIMLSNALQQKFPSLTNHIERLDIKQQKVYIKLDSPLLQYELQLQKKEILGFLQENITMGKNSSTAPLEVIFT